MADFTCLPKRIERPDNVNTNAVVGQQRVANADEQSGISRRHLDQHP
jgi:hypothetical protein